MELEITLKEFGEKCKQIVDSFREQAKGLGLGGSDTNLIKNILVKSPGGSKKLISMASVMPGNAGIIVITPYNSNTLGLISSAINSLDIGTVTSGSGKLFFQPQKVTLEVIERKFKFIKTIANTFKNNLRSLRQNWVKKHSKNKKSLGEDNYNNAFKKLEKTLKDSSGKIDEQVDSFIAHAKKLYGYKS
jgi:ribosome recycling factor